MASRSRFELINGLLDKASLIILLELHVGGHVETIKEFQRRIFKRLGWEPHSTVLTKRLPLLMEAGYVKYISYEDANPEECFGCKPGWELTKKGRELVRVLVCETDLVPASLLKRFEIDVKSFCYEPAPEDSMLK